MPALIYLIIYALIIFILAYIVVLLLGKAGVNGTVRTVVYVIAALLVLILLLNFIGALSLPLWPPLVAR